MEIDLQQITNFLTEYGLKVIGAVVILIIGRLVAGMVRKGLRKGMAARNVDPSLVGFLSSLVYAAVMAFVFLSRPLAIFRLAVAAIHHRAIPSLGMPPWKKASR